MPVGGSGVMGAGEADWRVDDHLYPRDESEADSRSSGGFTHQRTDCSYHRKWKRGSPHGRTVRVLRFTLAWKSPQPTKLTVWAPRLCSELG